MLPALMEAHDSAKAQFGKLAEARRTLDLARAEMESLTKLGDMVTPEDVIKGTGKLVAAGLSPLALAKLLSDMPEKGDALQGWIGGHLQRLEAREAQLEPVLASARHQLGVAGMRALIGHAIVGEAAPQAAGLAGPQPEAAPATAAPNPLMGGPSSAN